MAGKWTDFIFEGRPWSWFPRSDGGFKLRPGPGGDVFNFDKETRDLLPGSIEEAVKTAVETFSKKGS